MVEMARRQGTTPGRAAPAPRTQGPRSRTAVEEKSRGRLLPLIQFWFLVSRTSFMQFAVTPIYNIKGLGVGVNLQRAADYFLLKTFPAVQSSDI